MAKERRRACLWRLAVANEKLPVGSQRPFRAKRTQEPELLYILMSELTHDAGPSFLATATKQKQGRRSMLSMSKEGGQARAWLFLLGLVRPQAQAWLRPRSMGLLQAGTWPLAVGERVLPGDLTTHGLAARAVRPARSSDHDATSSARWAARASARRRGRSPSGICPGNCRRWSRRIVDPSALYRMQSRASGVCAVNAEAFRI